jgi:micrococcal nuclease
VKNSIVKYSLLFLSIVTFCTCKNRKGKYTNIAITTTDTLYKVIAIIDGDTYDALYKQETIRIRMEAMDAPEKGMPYYNVAKQYLSSMIFGRLVKIVFSKKDRYNRYIGRTFLEDGTDISIEMIKNGLAWYYRDFSKEKDLSLSLLEQEARKDKIGLWKDANPYQPWKIRDLHKQGISTKDSFPDL